VSLKEKAFSSLLRFQHIKLFYFVLTQEKLKGNRGGHFWSQQQTGGPNPSLSHQHTAGSFLRHGLCWHACTSKAPWSGSGWYWKTELLCR